MQCDLDEVKLFAKKKNKWKKVGYYDLTKFNYFGQINEKRIEKEGGFIFIGIILHYSLFHLRNRQLCRHHKLLHSKQHPRHDERAQ